MSEMTQRIPSERIPVTKKISLLQKCKRDWRLLVMSAPCILHLFVFAYIPMAGILYAFQNFSFRKPLLENKWVGFKHFESFLSSYYFWDLIRNTLIISITSLVTSLFFCILLALMVSEMRDGYFKRTLQSVTYLPYFISTVVVVGIMATMLDPNYGVINNVLKGMGMESVDFFRRPEWFLPLYLISGLWQGVGWGSIIYLGSISTIDPTLYEAARIDGCGRFRQIWYITLPEMKPIVITLLLLSIGGLLNVGHTKIILMYTPSTYSVADVISTYVYRRGIGGAEFSFGTAVGLFNSTVNLFLLVICNWLAKKFTDNSLF